MPIRASLPGNVSEPRSTCGSARTSYSLIPPHLPEYGGTLFSPYGQRDAGRKWFASVRSRLEQTVCCQRIDDPDFEDAAKLVVVIGDSVSTVVVEVPPVLVASIIVRMGLAQLLRLSVAGRRRCPTFS